MKKDLKKMTLEEIVNMCKSKKCPECDFFRIEKDPACFCMVVCCLTYDNGELAFPDKWELLNK